MSGISTWVQMETPEAVDVLDAMFDVVDVRVVPMGDLDLRPRATGPFVVAEDDGQGGEKWTYFVSREACLAYAGTVDGFTSTHGLMD